MNTTALVTFAFVASITPGPNNILLWASGFNHGLRRTVPHLLGTVIGVVSMMLLMALGLGALLERFPAIIGGIRLGGASYLLYLAYRLATSDSAVRAQGRQPLSIREAIVFQYLNPKLWMMAVTAVGMSLSPQVPLLAGAAALAALIGVVIVPCIVLWASAGTGIGRLFEDERRRRVVNLVLASMLVATVPLLLM